MRDFIKTQYARILIRFSDTKLDKKEILRRYLRRYRCIDISKECLNSRIQ